MFGYKIQANPRFQWGANQSRTYISLALESWRLSLGLTCYDPVFSMGVHGTEKQPNKNSYAKSFTFKEPHTRCHEGSSGGKANIWSDAYDTLRHCQQRSLRNKAEFGSTCQTQAKSHANTILGRWSRYKSVEYGLGTTKMFIPKS